jgi:hypothetical protein
MYGNAAVTHGAAVMAMDILTDRMQLIRVCRTISPTVAEQVRHVQMQLPQRPAPDLATTAAEAAGGRIKI